jgi:ribosomal protein S18 acetylase RimI-like enzyme
LFDDRTRPEDTLVARIAGEAVGYLALRRPTSLPSNGHVLEICGLAVDAEHQGRGIARSLLAAGMREARRRGARRLTLKVLATNRGARRLYEGAGFGVEGVLRGEFLLDGRYVDDVLMAVDLS